jgi:hypothetical protein
MEFKVVPIIEPTPAANAACVPATLVIVMVVDELELTSNVTRTPCGSSSGVNSCSARRAVADVDIIVAFRAVQLYNKLPVNACVMLTIFTLNSLGPYMPLRVCLKEVAMAFIAETVGAPVDRSYDCLRYFFLILWHSTVGAGGNNH